MTSFDNLPATLRTDRVRMVALLYPKEGLSFEEFDRYWLNEHSKVFTSIDIVKKNFLKYEQFHFSPKINEMIAAQGATPPSHYGMAVFEAESFEKIMEVFTHPDYLRVVVPDGEKFFDFAKSTMIGGQFAEVISR